MIAIGWTILSILYWLDLINNNAIGWTTLSILYWLDLINNNQCRRLLLVEPYT